MLPWYLITTKLKAEHLVAESLRGRHGLAVFFPRYPARKTHSATGLPLFPRYLFVQLDLASQLDLVRYAPGVGRFVSFGERIEPVPDQVVAELIQRCDANGVLLAEELQPGQAVRVTTGVFEGFRGIITERRGDQRVRLLLQLAFGGPLKIELEVDCVQVDH